MEQHTNKGGDTTTTLDLMEAIEGIITHAIRNEHVPASPRQLAERISEALLPKGRLLVSFEAVTQRESSDYESCQPGYDYTTLAHPVVLAHKLTANELARLHFETETQGLAESKVFDELEKTINTVTKPQAREFRKNALANRNKLFFSGVGPS